MLNLSGLNPQQRQAVETIHGPVLILAGAGTGKTRVITHRVAFLIHKGIPAENILGVTFTNKAAREMSHRVRQLVPGSARNERGNPEDKRPSGPTLCTFHSLCVRILRQHIEALGYKRNFVIYDESEQLSAVKKILARISARGEKLEPAGVLSALSRIRSTASGAYTGGDPSAWAIAQHVRPHYEAVLRACNAVDFDDLILLTLRLFEEGPDALAACRSRYRYVMVDEYQDTNAAQFKVVHDLTREHRNLCVVGDDDQSIYGWRGADLSNLLDMEKHFPEVKVIRLEQNYRSTNTILNAANAVIRHNVLRRGKKLWSAKGEGRKVTLLSYANEEAEARAVVEQVNYARVQGAPWGQQAILFRTNAQARPLETALRQARVRYHLVGGQSFFDRREVRDFLAYLKMFLNPHDDISLLRVANVPPRGLSEGTMEKLLKASSERHCSVYAAMRNPALLATFPSRSREPIEAFAGLIDRTRAALENAATPGGRRLQNWADHFLNEVGYFQDLRRGEKTAEAAEARIRNIKEMMATLDGDRPGELAPPERLNAFLEEVTLDTEREEEEEAGDAVTLITMHSCKGLEFPHVYIVGMEDGLLPHSRSEEERTLDEERRLFYVAITRAMQSLTISHCAARKKFGTATVCHPSRFLKDLPPELVEDGHAAGARKVTAESGKSRFDELRASLGLNLPDSAAATPGALPGKEQPGASPKPR